MQVNAKNQSALEFASALEELVAFYQTRDRSVVCYYDISVSECHALAAIERFGPAPLKKIVSSLRLDKSTTSRIVSSLLKKGYVQCHRDEEDARRIRISVTNSGRGLHNRVRLDLHKEYIRILRKYPSSFARQIPGFLREVTREAKLRHGIQES
jgi:DNA-binding MarR family transcriptional regulator